MQFLNIATVPVMTEQFLNTAECESRCNESRADCINQHVSTRLYQKLLILRGRVSKEDAIIMIDSGASRNFLSHAFVLKNKIRLDTENKDIIRLADGRNIEGNGTVNSLRYSIGQYTARSNFSVTKLTQGYDMILGKPWLTKVNPRINWQTNELRIRSKSGCIVLRGLQDSKDKQLHKLEVNKSSCKHKLENKISQKM